MPLIADKIVPWPQVKPYDKQSVPVPGTKRPGQSGMPAETRYHLTSNARIQLIIATVKPTLLDHKLCLV